MLHLAGIRDLLEKFEWDSLIFRILASEKPAEIDITYASTHKIRLVDVCIFTLHACVVPSRLLVLDSAPGFFFMPL
jgi:hypothetical protein